MIPGRQDHPFRLYTVSDKTAPIQAGGGMKIVPDYSFANAPAPKVIVIPAQRDRKSTRLNSSHSQISYAVFCLKKKTANITQPTRVWKTCMPCPPPLRPSSFRTQVRIHSLQPRHVNRPL